MPGLQGENVVAALGSPVRRNKLSLKFLQRKETKRALDFSESQADEPKAVDSLEPEPRWVCVTGLLVVLDGLKYQPLSLFIQKHMLDTTEW